MKNKKWAEEFNKHGLYFSPYPYDMEYRLAEVFYEDDGGWCYNSVLLDATDEYLGSDSLEDAKEEIEYMIENHYEDEINYYKEMLDKFLERY